MWARVVRCVYEGLLENVLKVFLGTNSIFKYNWKVASLVGVGLEQFLVNLEFTELSSFLYLSFIYFLIYIYIF